MGMSKLVFLTATALLASACTCRPRRGLDAGGPGTTGGGDTIPSTNAAEGPLKPVYFGFDSYALSGTAKDVLRQNSEWLKANPTTAFQVEGHCDERGTNEYNQVLGANRARAAADYLRSLGIGNDRMSTVSYGEEMPIDTAHTEEAWAKNRRAQFRPR